MPCRTRPDSATITQHPGQIVQQAQQTPSSYFFFGRYHASHTSLAASGGKHRLHNRMGGLQKTRGLTHRTRLPFHHCRYQSGRHWYRGRRRRRLAPCTNTRAHRHRPTHLGETHRRSISSRVLDLLVTRIHSDRMPQKMHHLRVINRQHRDCCVIAQPSQASQPCK